MADGEVSNDVLLEKINGFRQFYETRHAELMERVTNLERAVKESAEDSARRAGALELEQAREKEQLKSLWKSNAAHKQAHLDNRTTLIAVVGVLVTAAGTVSYFISLLLHR